MYRRQPVQLAHKTKLPWALGVVILMLLVVQVLVSNSIANYGSTISKIETDITDLTQANQLLEEKIASGSSLLTLSEKAQKIGFVKTITPQYFSNQIPVAFGGR